MKKYDVVASGFTVEKTGMDFQPVLKLITTGNSLVLLVLEFHYPDKVFTAADKEEGSVKMEVKNDNYSFIKKTRNMKRENEITGFLEENGLMLNITGYVFCDNIVEEKGNENSLYGIINWINRHKKLTFRK